MRSGRLGEVNFDPEPSFILEAATGLSFDTGPPLDFKSAPPLGFDPGSVGFERMAPFVFKLVTSCALRPAASLCFVTVTRFGLGPWTLLGLAVVTSCPFDLETTLGWFVAMTPFGLGP